MKKVFQTKFGKEGNCFAACIASMLDLEISDVPWLGETEDWNNYETRLNEYLSENHNLNILYYYYSDWEDYLDVNFKDSYYIISGKVESELQHSVIFKNRQLFHDPNPNKLKILEFIHIFIFLKLFK